MHIHEWVKKYVLRLCYIPGKIKDAQNINRHGVFPIIELRVGGEVEY